MGESFGGQFSLLVKSLDFLFVGLPRLETDELHRVGQNALRQEPLRVQQNVLRQLKPVKALSAPHCVHLA